MYMRVVHDELVFPEDRNLDKDTKSFIRGVSRTASRTDYTDTCSALAKRPDFQACWTA